MDTLVSFEPLFPINFELSLKPELCACFSVFESKLDLTRTACSYPVQIGAFWSPEELVESERENKRELV